MYRIYIIKIVNLFILFKNSRMGRRWGKKIENSYERNDKIRRSSLCFSILEFCTLRGGNIEPVNDIIEV
jgi:hypothetical protein